MNDNTGRVLTLRVKITDPIEAEWIWKAHLGKSLNGVQVEAIAEGDMFTERDEYKQADRFYIREEGETTEEAIEAHCFDGFTDIDEAASQAPKNVNPGSRWDIVDHNGNVYRSGVSKS